MAINADSSKQLLHELLRLTKYNLIAVGYQKLTVAGTAVSLTIPTDANFALITVESDLTTPAIRYLQLADVTLPTSTTGMPKSNLDSFDIHGYQNLVNFRAIQVAGGTHALNIEYYK